MVGGVDGWKGLAIIGRGSGILVPQFGMALLWAAEEKESIAH